MVHLSRGPLVPIRAAPMTLLYLVLSAPFCRATASPEATPAADRCGGSGKKTIVGTPCIVAKKSSKTHLARQRSGQLRMRTLKGRRRPHQIRFHTCPLFHVPYFALHVPDV